MLGMFSIMIVSIIGAFIAGKYIGGNVIIVRIELVLLAFICFTFGNLFRISSYEIEKIDNKDYLNTLLTSVLTILGTQFGKREIEVCFLKRFFLFSAFVLNGISWAPPYQHCTFIIDCLFVI